MHRHLAVVTLSCALVLAGCAGSDADSSADAENPTTAVQTSESKAATETEPAVTEEAEDASSPEVPATDAGSSTRALSISERHPQGTTLDISAITIEDRTVNLDAEFFNGGDNDVKVTIEGGLSIRLTDDAGHIYPFVKPADESASELALAPGESIGGTWTFLGGAADASELTLSVNTWENAESADQWDGSATPEFIVSVPLQ